MNQDTLLKKTIKLHYNPHALDLQNRNILPLEPALVPYQPQQIEPTVPKIPDFDLMKIVAEVQNDEEGDIDILLAAPQYESRSTTHTMAKKNSITKEAITLGPA